MSVHGPGARLAEVLTSVGAITDPAWHRAIRAVPRAPFIPDTVWVSSRDRPGWYRPITSDDPECPTWADADWSLITQVDDGVPAGEDGWSRLPTSSISQPSLVVAMLQALDARDGQRVLEIGTGTGYNTALLCERLGDERVTSVEIDPEVADSAHRALGKLGYRPRLVVGDGVLGVPDGAPYDRLLATVAAHDVPTAWIGQVRPGGVIVTPWSTWFSPGVLLRLEVAGDGGASGRFVGEADFMMLRSQRSRSPFGEWREYVDENDPAAVAGRTRTNPRWIAYRNDGWRLVAGHLVPGVDFVSYEAADGSGEASVYVFDRGLGTGSWALGEYSPREDSWETSVRGPRDLWAEIGAAWRVWQRAGRPGRDRLGLTVTPEGAQVLWADVPERTLTTA
ncbi:methyltransferase domain-containing protein [Marinactinospora rubrisoli]|uniref:Protein-L-isoaspartate O-methyltransferase n=1 Tax=Marinactinospora rubrisoli TaxID=2715399 RepID=A0ABW2KFA9_9ACTN